MGLHNSLSLSQSLIEYELDAFRRYHAIARHSFREAAQHFTDEVMAGAAEIESEEDRNEYLERYSWDYEELRDSFPDYLYKSFVLMVYSFVEDQLSKECVYINYKKAYGFDFAACRDRGVARARRFLEAVHGAVLVDSDWEDLLAIGKIRNVLAHNQGTISRPEDRKVIEGHVRRFKGQGIELKYEIFGLRPDERAELVIKDGYCDALIDFLLSFFKRLYSAL